MTGRLFSRVIDNSRQITSDAVDEPPGLSTRSTMARIDRSARASRMYSTSESAPTTAPLTGSKPLVPELITPAALITAIFERGVTPAASHDTCA
jgi:hypothetical protein